jgi:tripartite ATP-independent transporter DctP family solute receptor
VSVLWAFASGAPDQDKNAEAAPIIAVDSTEITGTTQVVDTHKFFAEAVARETGGKLLINRVATSVFGGYKQAAESLAMGGIQMMHMPNANASVYATGLMIWDLPFLFSDYNHQLRFAKSKTGQAIEQELLQKGMRILFYYDDGPRAIFNRLKPIKVPEDMSGMKVRVMENPVYMDTIRAFGGAPTPMSVSEIYMSIKQGVIDGVEISPWAFLVYKLEEGAKYVSYTNHVNPPASITCNAAWFAALPKDIQEGVLRAAAEASKYHQERWQADRKRVDGILRQSGVQVVDNVDTKLWEPKVRLIWEKYAAQIGGWDRIQAAIDLR